MKTAILIIISIIIILSIFVISYTIINGEDEDEIYNGNENETNDEEENDTEIEDDPIEINYNNPILYQGKYIFSLDFRDSQVNKLDLFVPFPKEWISQRQFQISTITPKDYDIGTESTHKNKYVYYESPPLINNKISVEENFNFISYEINTILDNENIEEYDKNSEIYKTYTKDEYKIETDYFRQVTPNVVKDETNPIKQARLIYDFVINRMNYYQMGGTLGGAKYAYINKRGECGDYSSLFVAMTRSIGIPSRPVIGFWANPSYGSTHVWAEFYIQDVGWIPVDTTIGEQSSTKREYYFGNMDNKRLIMSKNFNIELGEHNTDLFQVGAYWWWGSGDNAYTSFHYSGL